MRRASWKLSMPESAFDGAVDGSVSVEVFRPKSEDTSPVPCSGSPDITSGSSTSAPRMVIDGNRMADNSVSAGLQALILTPARFSVPAEEPTFFRFDA